MDQIKSYLSIALLALILSACGVKGKPLPPLVPVTIGRGEPVYSSATAKKKPVQNKYDYKLEEDNESEDSKDSGE